MRIEAWFVLGVAALSVLANKIALSQTEIPFKADPSMFRRGYDIPRGISHGTWDFDEWPGVDHPVVYKHDYMYNSVPGEKNKIDYFLSVFDEDDHEGYLKSPRDLLQRGFHDLAARILQDSGKGKILLGVFAHPDDEVLLAGGLLAYAARKGWNVKVILVSNGADGSAGTSEQPSDLLGGYNSAGYFKDRHLRIVTDRAGINKLETIKRYAAILGIDISVLPVDTVVERKRIVQIGEVPGTDFALSFGETSFLHVAIERALARRIEEPCPTIVLTHGSDGEYGSALHKLVRSLAIRHVENTSCGNVELYSGFPEYNSSDHITHFIDLHRDNRESWEVKWNAVKAIDFLYKPGADFDKPWDPTDQFLDGVFVKDYGYTCETAEPPRYEFYMKVNIKNRH
ncbi:MAG: PIG-L family deacetylase [Bacteroidota bacterium]|nr:PIG-L family deacetylase [Bacteroidota bacterium]